MARPYLGGSSASVKTVSADATLVPADSGKTILMGANGVDITLPSAAAGLEFQIIQTADYSTAVCKVISAEGNNIVGGILAQTGAGDNSGANVDYIEWGSGTVEGDMVSLVSDGSKWYVVGSRSKLTSDGIAFRST